MLSNRQIHILFLAVLCYIAFLSILEIFAKYSKQDVVPPMELQAVDGLLYLVYSAPSAALSDQERGQGGYTKERIDDSLAPFFFAKFSVNSASYEMLLSIPGIGPVMAQKIIAFRKEHGRIVNLEELLQIQGVGPKKLESFEKYLGL